MRGPPIAPVEARPLQALLEGEVGVQPPPIREVVRVPVDHEGREIQAS